MSLRCALCVLCISRHDVPLHDHAYAYRLRGVETLAPIQDPVRVGKVEKTEGSSGPAGCHVTAGEPVMRYISNLLRSDWSDRESKTD